MIKCFELDKNNVLNMFKATTNQTQKKEAKKKKYVP